MTSDSGRKKKPRESKGSQIARAGMQVAGGALPIFGGLLSAAAGAWGESAQNKMNEFLEQWLHMLQDELREKQETIAQIAARIDMQDEKIQQRVTSDEYQSLVKKAFREWSGVESDAKRSYIRNILANAASVKFTSDDVVRLFIEWIGKFSELHFLVIGAIYNENGISRGAVWEKIGKGSAREDSAEADLYKLLFHDLSTGHIVRQYRERTYDGQFVRQQSPKRPKGTSNQYLTSAFDFEKPYELTELGKQFVHYAMSDVPPKITYSDGVDN